jgi:hypothetical protein
VLLLDDDEEIPKSWWALNGMVGGRLAEKGRESVGDGVLLEPMAKGWELKGSASGGGEGAPRSRGWPCNAATEEPVGWPW